ncbi:hypothetical protein FPG87_12525 [Flavobacterium psychrophilum]|uniref:Uncharacterized protein n=1 Tax=Flavobacterium psychrophilum TaxID=96345 RepID=A0A7U2NHQ3_FLAPS|nr:hypothetical protein [Flavobacterium psychrophilum]OAE92163.1 hypothetical protein SU65_10435 [Flavobacterium psychrophilum]OJH10067.1 hypothetical protein FPG87_12525 [Flavobacterium psychrophilum]QRE05319.1 hypothetical protein H0H26_06955 [Flavobacterium psychrophilum]SNB07217.1 hypothetical protein KU05112810_190009 [Flavobacterium psychrophilum]
MRKFIPTKRLVELGLVLQYDTELQEVSKDAVLTDTQRFWINQERGKIMSGDDDYLQYATLEKLIEKILLGIRKQNWKPKTEIQYD